MWIFGCGSNQSALCEHAAVTSKDTCIHQVVTAKAAM